MHAVLAQGADGHQLAGLRLRGHAHQIQDAVEAAGDSAGLDGGHDGAHGGVDVHIAQAGVLEAHLLCVRYDEHGVARCAVDDVAVDHRAHLCGAVAAHGVSVERHAGGHMARRVAGVVPGKPPRKAAQHHHHGEQHAQGDVAQGVALREGLLVLGGSFFNGGHGAGGAQRLARGEGVRFLGGTCILRQHLRAAGVMVNRVHLDGGVVVVCFVFQGGSLMCALARVLSSGWAEPSYHLGATPTIKLGWQPREAR